MVSRMKGRGNDPGIGLETPPLKSRGGRSEKRPVIRTFVRSGQGFTVPNPAGCVPSPHFEDVGEGRRQAPDSAKRQVVRVRIQLSAFVRDFTLQL